MKSATANVRGFSSGRIFALALVAVLLPVGAPHAIAQTPGFVAPPRTISDITAILDQQKPDPVKAAANRAAAEAPPRAGAPAAELTRFYYDRGLAAFELGRTQQSVEDLRVSVRYGREAKHDVGRALEALYSAEVKFGNAKTAAAIAEDMAANDRRGGGAQITIATMLTETRQRLGDIEGARKALAAAERLLPTLINRNNTGKIFADHWTSTVENRAAVLMLETGRYAEAERSARKAVAARERAIPRYDEMAANTTLFMFTRGDTEKALENFRKNLAKTLLAQGRLVEAEVEARRALLNLLGRFGRYAPDTGTSISLLSSVLLEQGRLAEAETLAKAAVDSLENGGAGARSDSLAQALALVARTQAARERWTDARATFDRLATQVATDDDTRKRFVDGNIMLGLVRLKTGGAGEAVPIMQQAVESRSRKFGERHIDTAEARGFLAMALAASGQRDRAIAEFRAAVPIVLQSSRQSDDDNGATARDQRLQLVLESYMGVLADTRGPEAAAESFRLADAARGRSVQRALAAASARLTANPALADLARREQDAQKQIGALQGLLSNLLSSPTDQQDAGAVRDLRTQIDQLRDSRAKMREELEKRFPDYVNLIDPRPATIEQARAALKSGEALISTYVGAERTFVWAVPKDGAPAFAAAALRERDVETMARTLRKALDPNAATLDDIPAFDVALANRLYTALLAPVAAGWQNVSSLLIVPHKALAQIPFGLLVTEAVKPADAAGQPLFAGYKTVPFLIRKVAITQLPSVTSLATLRALPPGSKDRKAFAGFGDPWFSPRQAAEARGEARPVQVAQAGVQTRGLRLVRRNAPATQGVNSADLAMLPRLPDTADEVRGIAVALNADPTRDVFIGARASTQTVKTMSLADRKVVLFATHGLVPGDLNGLTQPALALSAPSVTNVASDGLLTMEDILGLRLNADWVVLSACNTASGDGAGAEAVSGLGRAFFYAGARALLVSNWPVETLSARALTTDLFRRQAADASLGRAEALRQAMIALIDGPGAVDATGKPQFSYAHPIFWAPFSVVGDGG